MNEELGYSYEQCRDQGYLGGVRQVNTHHIGQLIRQAADLRRMADGRMFPEPAPGGQCEGSGYTERTLERLANLLRHAAEEVEDERLRLRDGWPA